MSLSRYQTAPFKAKIPKAYRDHLVKDAARMGVHHGLFFSTSGNLCCERINPNASYDYIFRTDDPEGKYEHRL